LKKYLGLRMKFRRMKIKKFCREKVKLWKFSSESEIFWKIGGNLKQGGNASWSQGGWTPLTTFQMTSLLLSMWHWLAHQGCFSGVGELLLLFNRPC